MNSQWLRAGPFRMLYQDGALRYISLGQEEVVRMIYFALRDENWGTYRHQIEDEKIVAHENHFSLAYDCFHFDDMERRIFKWKVEISGTEAGIVTFRIRGTALSDVLKNRAGFCVLHPVQVAGRNCEVTHSDGTTTNSKFPEFVSPSNPFKDVTSMRWTSLNGGYFTLHFEGDVFETEDQRNWTDASFKTFCTPLDLPFPTMVTRNESVAQKVTFSGLLYGTARDHANIVRISLTNEIRPLPAIGTSASGSTELNSASVDLLSAVGLDHYRIRLHANSEYSSHYAAWCDQSRLLGLPLAIELHLTGRYASELSKFVRLTKENKVDIRHILLLSEGSFVTTPEIIDYGPDFLRGELNNAMVGAGTCFNFTEINRNRFRLGEVDFVSFSMHPQEHAFDERTLIENLEGQSEVVKSALQIFGDQTRIHVSPLTLRKRYNPYSAHTPFQPISDKERFDPRQQTLFGAIFTLGSILSLTKARASSVTLYEAVGPLGLVSEVGAPFPCFDHLKSVLQQRSPVRLAESSHPLEVEAIIFQKPDRLSTLLLNYTTDYKEVQLPGREVVVEPCSISILELPAKAEV